MKKSAFLVALVCLFCAAANDVPGQTLLNELSVNPPGNDGPCEFFELRGTPGAIVENLHFVSVEGDTGANPGLATAVVTFGVPGPAIGSNGLLIITGTVACGARTYPAGTTVLTTSLFDSSAGALQNGTNSFLLISSTTAITPNTDYDTDNNGTLESLPAGATIADGVSWSDGGAGDITYGTVLTASGGTIGAATRFPSNNTANSAAAWYAGALTGATSDSVTYSSTIRTSNFPPDGLLTPGAPNAGIPGHPSGMTFTAYLSGSQEVPSNTSPAKGFGRVTLNDAGNTITVSVSYGSAAVPLSTNVIGGHIHGPAAPGTNAPVLFDLMPAGGAAFGSVSNVTFSVTPQQVADLKAGLYYINIHTVSNPGGEIRGQLRVSRSVLDFNGDGLTDYVVARPAGGAGSQLTWFTQFNGGSPFSTRDWGVSGDQVLAGDYDGDGLDDIAVFRPSNATFYIIYTSTQTMRIEQFGQTGDNPRVVGDYDGDGRDDLAVYRSGAQSTWFYKTSSSSVFNSVDWGQTGDIPSPGDYDGDGRADFVVMRESPPNATFYKRFATGVFGSENFGGSGGRVAPGDYDGDGKTDICIVQVSAGFLSWSFRPSSLPTIAVTDSWGLPSDIIVQGDYTGDGRTDYAVWRPGSPGRFYVMTVGERSIFTKDWGQTGDLPVASYNTF